MSGEAMDRYRGRRRLASIAQGQQLRTYWAVSLPPSWARHAQLVVTINETGEMALSIEGVDVIEGEVR